MADPVRTDTPCQLDDAGVLDVVRRARERIWPLDVDGLAEFAVALMHASDEPPDLGEDSGEDVGEGALLSDRECVVRTLHGVLLADLIEGVDVAARADNLYKQIVNRGLGVNRDDPRYEILEEYVLECMASTSSTSGALCRWAADTSQDLTGFVRAVFHHELTDAPRFYRAAHGLPQRPRIEGAGRAAWTAAFRAFIAGPDESVAEFVRITDLPWIWPHVDELDDDAEAQRWAHNAWFQSFVEDATGGRYDLDADPARVARFVDGCRSRWGTASLPGFTEAPLLDDLVLQYRGEVAGVVLALESLLEDTLPQKHELIRECRSIGLLPGALADDVGSSVLASVDSWEGAVDDREVLDQLLDCLEDHPLDGESDFEVPTDELAQMMLDGGVGEPENLDLLAELVGVTIDEAARWWDQVANCAAAVLGQVRDDDLPGGGP